MQSGKKIAAVLSIVCLMGMLLVACGSAGQATNQKATTANQVYIFPEDGVSDIATFDPGLSTDLPSIQAIDMVFTGLVQLDDKGAVRAQLASSWDLAPDGLTWTFHLRPNLKFSDGTPLTSTDVAYSIDRALQPAEHSVVGPGYLALIKDSGKLVTGKIKTIINDSLLTPDPSTITIVTTKKAAYFLDALTYSTSYVLEKSLVDKYGKNFGDHLTEGGGDGPFKVAEYTHNKQIVFVPNPTYYGPHPQLAKVIMPFYKDLETLYKAYQVGQVDTTGALSIPSTHFQQAKLLTAEFHQVPQLYINYYTMNYLVKPFDNTHIREAFALAIDKSLVVHSVWKDSVIPTNHIVPQGMPGYNTNLAGPDDTPGTSGNAAKAQALLKQGLQEEGWASVSQMPSIKLTYASGLPDLAEEATVLEQMWQTVLGVNVKTEAIDFDKLLTESEAALNNAHGLQFWGIAWIADYPDPQDWTTLQFDKGANYNQANYGQNNSNDATQQQAAQQQLEAADVNSNQASRLAAYNQAEQQLVNDVAWLPMEQVTENVLLKTYVKGVVFNAQGLIPPDDWGAIYIAAH
jgi:oligopeptide transport system substrate-binding protein